MRGDDVRARARGLQCAVHGTVRKLLVSTPVHAPALRAARCAGPSGPAFAPPVGRDLAPAEINGTTLSVKVGQDIT